MTSNTSHTSSNQHNRKRKDSVRKRSGDSVQILSEDGKQALDASEEGWESGDAEDVKPTIDIRRTVSDTQAETARPSASATPKATIVDSPLAMPEVDAPPLLRQRTTGFAGTTHESTYPQQQHQYNDSTHVMPAHQVKHQSARDLAVMVMSDADGEREKDEGVGPVLDDSRSGTPRDLQRMRSTDGSGLAGTSAAVDKSPSFPFPKLPQQSHGESARQTHVHRRQASNQHQEENGEEQQYASHDQTRKPSNSQHKGSRPAGDRPKEQSISNSPPIIGPIPALLPPAPNKLP